MTPAEKRIASLRAGLQYASREHKPKILAMIAEIEAEQNSPSRGSALESAGLAETEIAPTSRGPVLEPSPQACRTIEDNGTLQPNTIVAAAQEPAPSPLRVQEADCRGSDVDASPVKARSEKAKVGGRTACPKPSSEGGHIPGTAGSLAPCSPPPAAQRRSEQRACQRCGRPLIGRWKAAAKYCVPCGNEVNRERRAKVELPKPEIEHRQPPLGRPRVALSWDPSIIIGPDRPAPLRRYSNGQPLPFQDDLVARADHGSGGELILPTYRNSPTGCSSAMAMGAA
jgi:hypothetical protein